MRVARVLFILAFGVWAGGCAAPAGKTSAAWVTAQGGGAADARQARAQAVGDRLLKDHPEIRIRLHVLASPARGAFSWPGGDVYLTTALMDAVTDDELAAAVAHELGHLLGDGRIGSAVSLRGCEPNLDREARADAIGIRLLAPQRIPAAAMASLLAKVERSPELSPACKSAIEERIRRIRTEL